MERPKKFKIRISAVNENGVRKELVLNANIVVNQLTSVETLKTLFAVELTVNSGLSSRLVSPVRMHIDPIDDLPVTKPRSGDQSSRARN